MEKLLKAGLGGFVICLAILTACDNGIKKEKILNTASSTQTETQNAEIPGHETEEKTGHYDGESLDSVTLIFSLNLNRRIYEDSAWGQAPQFSIWLEDLNRQKIRTVWVTNRTGSGKWIGKMHCPAALPYWVSRYNKETNTSGPPTFNKPVVDAITGPTPESSITIKTTVPHGSEWKYFVEINISGDFNFSFPSMMPSGEPDPYGNGQPSLVYQGQIKAIDNQTNTPKLIGRTDQWQKVDELITDLKGITTAKELLASFEVICRKQNFSCN